MTITYCPVPHRTAGDAVPLEAHDRSRYRAAAHHARSAFRGPLGELACRELLAHADFGYQGGPDVLVARLASIVLATPARDARCATSCQLVDLKPGDSRSR
jgi:hypothetical protein